MASIEAVIFDFVGTLVNVRSYSLEASEMKLYETVKNAGFNVDAEDFLRAYSEAHQKYRVVRYRKLVEVTNAIWISESLNNLGFKATPDHPHVKQAVNVFFEDYLNGLELRPCVEDMLKRLSTECRLGLISNFTYAPVIYGGVRKLGINQYFNSVLVSGEVGWRKPHPKIFREALRRLRVVAHQTVYVGDSPLEDVKGAEAAGMKTIFVSSQFHSLEDLCESKQQPDEIVEDICGLSKFFWCGRRDSNPGSQAWKA